MTSCEHDNRDPPHHLIYREEIKKDGEKEVLCWACDEPIWGSLHTCVEGWNRPYHKYKSTNHCLDFTEKLENDGNKEVRCWGCNELVLGPAYKCSRCSFFIHNSCADLLPEIDHPMHPDHTLSLQEPGRNCCHACSTSHDISLFYQCRSCDYQLDINCANRFPFNPNECHQHQFLFTWKQRNQFHCETCGEQIMSLVFGVCNICKLLVHKKCAEIQRTVKIMLHNHSLNLVYSLHKIKNREDIFCSFCRKKVSTKYAAYCCDECNFFVHSQCVQKFIDQYGKSLAIGESMQSVGHVLIKALNHVEDEGPHPKEIQHFSHQQHKLILCDDEVKDDKLCEGCMKSIISVPFYKCAECDFFLHTRCTKLPTRIEQHRLHYFHTLTLLQQAPNKSTSMSYCGICFRRCRGFTYKCDTCWEEEKVVKTLDIQCGLIPETLKHEGHQHTLFLALDRHYYRVCKACNNERSVFRCTNCDFTLGIKCANLPLLARHKYDAHFLRLTYTAEANYGEYYCLICEETRDPNHWFYYCKTCDFPAHIECVIKN